MILSLFLFLFVSFFFYFHENPIIVFASLGDEYVTPQKYESVNTCSLMAFVCKKSCQHLEQSLPVFWCHKRLFSIQKREL